VAADRGRRLAVCARPGRRRDDPAVARLCATAFEAVWERAVPHEKFSI